RRDRRPPPPPRRAAEMAGPDAARARRLSPPSRLTVLAALLPLALVWQVSDLGILPAFGWRLDPPLVLAVAAGLLLGPRVGVWFGLVAGAGQDLLLGAGLLYAATKALAGFVAGLVQPQLYRLD